MSAMVRLRSGPKRQPDLAAASADTPPVKASLVAGAKKPTAAASKRAAAVPPKPVLRARRAAAAVAAAGDEAQAADPARRPITTRSTRQTTRANGTASHADTGVKPAPALTRKRKLGEVDTSGPGASTSAAASPAVNFIMSSPKRKPREALSRIHAANGKAPDTTSATPKSKRRRTSESEAPTPASVLNDADTSMGSPGFHSPLAKRIRQATLGRSTSDPSALSTPTRTRSTEQPANTPSISNGGMKDRCANDDDGPSSPLKSLLISPMRNMLRRVSGFVQGTLSGQETDSDPPTAAPPRAAAAADSAVTREGPRLPTDSSNSNGTYGSLLPLMPGSFTQLADDSGAQDISSLTAPPMNPTSLAGSAAGTLPTYLAGGGLAGNGMQLYLPESQESGSTSPMTLGYPETPSKENIPMYSDAVPGSGFGNAQVDVSTITPLNLGGMAMDDQQHQLAAAAESDLSQVSSIPESEVDAHYDAYMDFDDDDEYNPYLFMASLPPIPKEHTLRPYALPRKTRSSPPITLVLDLDETLVHCALTKVDNADLVFPVEYNGVSYDVYCRLRPGYQEFLQRASALFEVVVFTASQQVYADRLLNLIDPDRRYIRHRLFRDSCVYVNTNYVKDLGILGRDESKMLLVDNCPQAFAYQQSNGIPIESWYEDKGDRELLRLMEFLETLVGEDDVRPKVEAQFKTREKIAEAQLRQKNRAGGMAYGGPIWVRGM